MPLKEASLEVAEGLYAPETLGNMIDRSRIIDSAMTLILPNSGTSN
ncbi:hypothetical protein MC7420_3579 [Coleofasciculus chthonoplastes PCC 7420]|uniref:Uncharacterized protein n=1 Tax=Coleofasciculus chthonoplastes PCC 7420 TaxID=118168 RepID=B4VZX8_9CYAN|nr:hypothetical protein [Coleofasciculus chthonoplastes]EDX72507.1 hypothetical protein MC7420_3579 [Coleofasciculus chthonoplastes PCC 7420]